MNRILIFRFLIPFISIVLLTGILYGQYQAVYKENVHAKLRESAHEGRQAIERVQIDRWSVLRSTINISALMAALEKASVGKKGFFFLIDGNGQTLVQSSNVVQPAEDSVADLLKNKVRSGEPVLTHEGVDHRGRKSLYAMTSLNGDNWHLIYLQRASDALSGLKIIRLATLCVLFMAFLCIPMHALRISNKKMARSNDGLDKKKVALNEQLFHIEKLASIGELEAGIAHEIKNPVAIMVEEAGWMEDLLEDEEFRRSKNLNEFKRSLKQIKDEGGRCKEIIDRLLNFTRKSDFRLQKVHLGELIEDMIAISSKKAKYCGVRIQRDIQEGLPSFHLPQTELQQVLLNLMSNAIDAMEERGGGTLAISAKLDEEQIILEVSDNGPGIEKENIPRLFDPFFTTKPVGKGTGLGLAICYRIVRKMGGRIHVKSKVGLGTTIQVMIPASGHGESNLGALGQTRIFPNKLKTSMKKE